MLLFLLILSVVSVFYFLRLNYQYWSKRGVPGPKPIFFFGNVGQSFFLKKSLAQIYGEIYTEYQNAPIVGIYRSITPTLIVRDPEIIKEITVKSFSNFHDNEIKVDKETDPLFGRNPFVLRGEEWKITRLHLTRAFTSGKMKTIYPLLEDIGEKFVKFVENHLKASNGEGCDSKDLCMRFTLNNVGSCAFGLEAKCFEEKNGKFKQLADRFFSSEASHMVKIFLMGLIPFLTKVISIKITPKDVEEELTNLVSQTLKYREENNIVRNDFLHGLFQLKKSSNDGEFTDVDITAHAAGFFVDGYETSSIAMSFLLYELARNPQVQDKLREEVSKTFKENNGKIPYEILQGLPYLDGVVNEGLRMYPPLGNLNKVCTKSFTYIPKADDVITKPVTIETGTTIVIPLYGLHHDPRFYEDPDSFRPERFIGVNKEKLTKYTFMPFGEGPRSCLGQRFGILQIKTGVVHLIKNFEVCVNKKTKIPIQYNPIYFLTSAQGGLWLDFKKVI